MILHDDILKVWENAGTPEDEVVAAAAFLQDQAIDRGELRETFEELAIWLVHEIEELPEPDGAQQWKL